MGAPTRASEKTELENVLLAAAAFLEKHRRVDLAVRIRVDEQAPGALEVDQELDLDLDADRLNPDSTMVGASVPARSRVVKEFGWASHRTA